MSGQTRGVSLCLSSVTRLPNASQQKPGPSIARAENVVVNCSAWPGCSFLLLRLLGVFAVRLNIDLLHMVVKVISIPQTHVDGIPVILGIENEGV